jgi:hypothetical protein
MTEFRFGRYLALCICVCALWVGVAACGSSGTTSTPHPVLGGVAATARGSAPDYCVHLTESGSLLAVGRAVNELAENPRSRSAKVTLKGAAAALRRAARQAPDDQRAALLVASKAIRVLAAHGLGEAGRTQRALAYAGHETEHSCDFPVG